MGMVVVLTPKQICERFQISRMTLYRWRKEYHDFPKPVWGNGRPLKFDVQQVMDWYQKCLKQASQTDTGA